MKIAYFTDMFLPQVNGIASSLATQAKALGETGHQVLIFTPKLDDIKRSKFQAKNVHVVHLPTVPALVYTEFKVGVFGLPKALRYLLRFNPDIIHLHSPFTVGWDGVLAAKLLKIPLVGTIHIYVGSPDYLRWIKSALAVKILDKMSERYLNFFYRQCNVVTSPSQILAEELSKNGFKKMVHYLPNPVRTTNPRRMSVKSKEAQKIKYQLKEKVILHFGRLSYEKNIDVCLKAFRELSKKHKNISLLIIGDGPAKRSLKKLARDLKITKDVVFTGFIDHQYLLSSGILGIANVFVTASTMENAPMVVLEAMSYGLPIVGVRQAGMIELISSNGLLVKPGDTESLSKAIEKILFDEKLAKEMGAQSLKLIQEYSVDKITEKLLRMYQRLKFQASF